MDRKKLFLSLLKKLTIEEMLDLCSKFKEESNIPTYDDIRLTISSYNESKISYENTLEDFYKTEEYLENNNINFISYLDINYPKKLRHISQSPKLLYYKGDLTLCESKFSIAIVGTRKPSNYGIWAAKKFSKELSSNSICIISGMASGIDKYAHEGAYLEIGKTICVLGSTIDKPYPKANSRLMESIINSGGLVLSEYGNINPIIPANFAYRNRLVSGLSDGILIIEAGMKSGTLITADFGLEQGKNIFAIPGSIDSSSSIGTNNLIKQGAQLVTSIDDILNVYDIKRSSIDFDEDLIKNLSITEVNIYNFIKEKGLCSADMISLQTSINIKDVLGILNILDIKSIINYDGYIASLK